MRILNPSATIRVRQGHSGSGSGLSGCGGSGSGRGRGSGEDTVADETDDDVDRRDVKQRQLGRVLTDVTDMT